MLNPNQFGNLNPMTSNKAKESNPTLKNTSGYKFPPPIKSQEERDLMEAKAKALNLKTQQNLYKFNR